MSLCEPDQHEWIRVRRGARPLLLPAFLEDGGEWIVKVECAVCGTVTRMLLKEYERTSRRG